MWRWGRYEISMPLLCYISLYIFFYSIFRQSIYRVPFSLLSFRFRLLSTSSSRRNWYPPPPSTSVPRTWSLLLRRILLLQTPAKWMKKDGNTRCHFFIGNFAEKLSLQRQRQEGSTWTTSSRNNGHKSRKDAASLESSYDDCHGEQMMYVHVYLCV